VDEEAGSNAPRHPAVSVATVTYGDRWHLLVRVLEYIEADPKLDRVIVVDNGARAPIAALVQRACFRKAIVVGNPRNLGSAAGFKLGSAPASFDLAAVSGCSPARRSSTWNPHGIPNAQAPLLRFGSRAAPIFRSSTEPATERISIVESGRGTK
jgi:hypothetical protein